jgi:hypothetical protein
MGKENTIIEGFIEAKYNTATPTTLTFTHETWEYFHAEIDKKYKDKKIVGWIHTHPNFGIFLSENDRFIQQNFFTDSNQVAYVVDPIQNDEGFFFWINDKLERCPGFYLFDKNGVKIKQKIWNKDDEISYDNETETGKKSNFWMIVLIIALIANLFFSMSQGKKISKLEKQVEDQNVVIQYGMYGAVGAPDVSVIAENIRMQIEMQKKARQQAAQDAMKQQNKQDSKEEENSKENNNENTEQIPETSQNDNINETSKEIENNGGNE